jgi:transcriptional regulator with XRE-family HTH domain
MSKSQSIVDQLRQAIAKAEKRGTTRYRIAKVSGVHQSQIARIATGEAVPRLDSAEAIATACGVRLILQADT